MKIKSVTAYKHEGRNRYSVEYDVGLVISTIDEYFTDYSFIDKAKKAGSIKHHRTYNGEITVYGN